MVDGYSFNITNQDQGVQFKIPNIAEKRDIVSRDSHRLER